MEDHQGGSGGQRAGQPFGQHASFDHAVRDWREWERIVGYIETNPVRAGLVGSAEAWPWSGASDKAADPADRLDKTGVISHVPAPDAHSDSHEM